MSKAEPLQRSAVPRVGGEGVRSICGPVFRYSEGGSSGVVAAPFGQDFTGASVMLAGKEYRVGGRPVRHTGDAVPKKIAWYARAAYARDFKAREGFGWNRSLPCIRLVPV